MPKKVLFIILAVILSGCVHDKYIDTSGDTDAAESQSEHIDGASELTDESISQNTELGESIESSSGAVAQSAEAVEEVSAGVDGAIEAATNIESFLAEIQTIIDYCEEQLAGLQEDNSQAEDQSPPAPEGE